jgi:DNA repair protein RecO (recombination protein O)
VIRVQDQPAFVLHQRPYGETSMLLEAMTRDQGRVGLIARGVRSARPRHARGLLSPFVALRLGYSGRGELLTLTGAEPAGAPMLLVGRTLMSGLYVNELLVRLLQRHDPHPELLGRYALLLEELSGGAEPGWALRRFERDLLAALGFSPLLTEVAGHAAPVDPAQTYSYDPEHGPVPFAVRSVPPRVSGRALLALADDARPDPEVLRELRHMMRAVLRHHLGGRELNAWRTLAQR